nr:hypothetical protein [Sporanaerobium hydrogeniformans]
MYGEGISKEGDVLDLASNIDIVNKSGAWYSYGDVRLGQGRENSKIYLKEHSELLTDIENEVRKHYGIKEAEVGAGVKVEENLSLLDEGEE